MLAARTGAWALPYDAEVEWIKGRGSQYSSLNNTYINTLVNANDRIEFEIIAKIGPFTSEIRNNAWWMFGYDTYFLGETSRSRALMFGGGTAHNASRFLLFGGEYIYQNPKSWPLNVAKFEFVDHQFREDGIVQKTFEDKTFAGGEMFLFACNQPGSSVGTLANPLMECHGCKIWEAEDLVRDFIPVRFTNERGVSEGAMYDRVSGQLFRNAGNGSFQIGPDKAAVNGGGYKCLTPRRSYRRSARPSARFYAALPRLEVAA